MKRVCRTWKVARSTVYSRRQQKSNIVQLHKRGPKTQWSDEELTELIVQEIADSPWLGEGYRKVWAQLRTNGTRTSRARVLRLMRENHLLATKRKGNPHGPAAHDRSITTDTPDVMWGTDATSTLTLEGPATIFIAVDHHTTECIGIHAARKGNRFEALEPIRQGVRRSFDQFSQNCAEGLTLRHNHGDPYTSYHFQKELKFLGIISSPSFIREPECNGCAERFIKTLKEQVLWVQQFATIAELQDGLHRFKAKYNATWLVQKHNYSTPSQVRDHAKTRNVA